ncbi:hypothetical protein TNCV_1779891 [Trichonephila clavipes]|nr:hypothetical protein TNCV_1779891 [Trichonephila clavipes]
MIDFEQFKCPLLVDQRPTSGFSSFMKWILAWPLGSVESKQELLRHGGTLDSRRDASPLVRWVEGEKRWETSGHHQDFLPLNWGGTEQNCTVTCMVLKAKANDRCKNSSLELRGISRALI